jgi:hypothetical protein
MSYLLVASDSQMNFTQLHERLRMELLRRIQRRTLSVSLLARQTGFGTAHLSSFLRCRKRLSLEAMDRILAAQRMTAADLLPLLHQGELWPEASDGSAVPVVSHATALFEPLIRPSAVQWMLHLPEGALESVRARSPNPRRAWQRFIAVRVPSGDAEPMEPLVFPDAIALIDRHYTSLLAYRPKRPNLYAVRNGSKLTVRYLEFLSWRLVLRPLNIAFPVELIEVDPGGSPGEFVAGRVVLILNSL